MKRYEGLFAYPINHPKIDRSLDTVTDCGHYYAINSSDLSGIDDSDTDFGHILSRRNFTSMHMIVSSNPAYTDGQLDGFDVASLVLPGGLPTEVNSRNNSADLPHPFVSIAHVNADANKTSRTNPSDVSGGFIVKELAYRSDAETYSAKVLNNVGVPAYTPYPYQALDENPLVNYSNGGYEVSDFYLQSLKSISGELVVYYDCNGTEQIVHDSRYANKIIRNPASFANYAGECTTVKVMSPNGSEVYGEQYFVNGVKINPLMRAVLYADIGSGSRIYGISYMAYASHQISLDTKIEDIYEQQLITTANTTNKPVTLHTSKFSNGVPGTNARTDMYNVWWLCIHDNSIKWCPAITDLVVAYSGGKLIIDFNLRCDIFNASPQSNPQYALPVASSTETETVNKYKFDNQATKLKWNNEHITSVYLDLPIDPSIGNYLFNVPRVRLFGYCVGIGQPSYGVSGEYLRESTPLGYEMGTVVTQLPYECPLVRINLNTITRLNNYKSAVVPIHLEGLVNYEY